MTKKKAYLVNIEGSIPVVIHAETRNIARYRHLEQLSIYFDHEYIDIKAKRVPGLDTLPSTSTNANSVSGYCSNLDDSETDEELLLMICGCEICLDELRRM